MNVDLNSTAAQAEFGELVGASRQAINRLATMGVLAEGGSYLDWLRQYCERLRLGAAGRGGGPP